VIWKDAVSSLNNANRYFVTVEPARRFAEIYMKQIIGILLEQQPSKIGQSEKACVEESLIFAVTIVAKDLKIQLERNGQCLMLDVIALIFNRKKVYYKGNKWNAGHMNGLPEVRLRMIERFRIQDGFKSFAAYLQSKISTKIFPPIEMIHFFLDAISDLVPSQLTPTASGGRVMEDDAVLVGRAIMNYISSVTDEILRLIPTDLLNTIRHDLQRVYDRIISSKREECYYFYSFWRDLVFLLISSQSLPIRLFGWEQMKDLIDASQDHRPPPREYIVSDAGVSFVNGRYHFAGTITADGYAQRGMEIKYERRIPQNEADGGGKVLTLFRCLMRSQQKWWFLSEADKEQPGTDRDIDYYQHKSKEDEESLPPPSGWNMSRNTGKEPPPRLKAIGLMVPEGQELNTLEHQLAKWAIDKKIVEHVLGASIHREVVHRSIPLIEFLAQMCCRDQAVQGKCSSSSIGANAYCLKESHLLLAWKTCTNKSDAAVSDEIYQLLTSILPSLPITLAISLLKAVQLTMHTSMMEVAEFCSCFANRIPIDSLMSEEVRSVILDLMWFVLTHPDASTLKCYEVLKKHVSNELRREPFGRRYREKFLKICTETLLKNGQLINPGVDELLALRMVKLTQFVLETCPREQAEQIVSKSNGELPALIFSELVTGLIRRQKQVDILPRKVSLTMRYLAITMGCA
jgi:hypothetical protein